MQSGQLPLKSRDPPIDPANPIHQQPIAPQIVPLVAPVHVQNS